MNQKSPSLLNRWTPASVNYRRWRRQCMQVGLDLLFPRRCAYCDNEILDNDMDLCLDCRERLVPKERMACRRCGAVAANRPDHAEGCITCRDRRLRFSEAQALGSYQGDLRTAVLRMKNPSGDALAAVMGRLLWQRHGPRLRSWRADVLVPIPMHWSRRLVRGANSAEVVAEVLASELQLPSEPRLLKRRRNTAPQGELSLGERLENLRGAFRLRGGCSAAGARVLLIDDILTTGATCNEAARTLLRAGASDVVVAVVARAER